MDTELLPKQFHKIIIRQDDSSGYLLINEGVWAKAISHNLFIIDNIPFYAFLYSTGDLVRTEIASSEIIVRKLVIASGNSTIRISGNISGLKATRELILANACDAELSTTAGLLAINIPRNISYNNILSLLISQCALFDLDYEESCISEHHKAS